MGMDRKFRKEFYYNGKEYTSWYISDELKDLIYNKAEELGIPGDAPKLYNYTDTLYREANELVDTLIMSYCTVFYVISAAVIAVLSSLNNHGFLLRLIGLLLFTIIFLYPILSMFFVKLKEAIFLTTEPLRKEIESGEKILTTSSKYCEVLELILDYMESNAVTVTKIDSFKKWRKECREEKLNFNIQSELKTIKANSLSMLRLKGELMTEIESKIKEARNLDEIDYILNNYRMEES